MTDKPYIDLSDGRFYAGDCHAAYTWMRRHGPVFRDDRSGMVGIAGYDAVLAASKDSATFSNAGGSRPDLGPLAMMIDMDAPLHVRRRKLVSAGFTPHRVRDHELWIRDVCDELIDRVCERGECDFVRDIAAPLPMIVIGDLLGVAPDDRDRLLRWSDDMVSAQGGNITDEVAMAALTAFGEYEEWCRDAIAARRSDPTDDLLSVLVHAEVDGERLDEDALVHESLLILVGGDETTRHVISGGMEQLMLHPDQCRQLIGAPSAIKVAVEEMLRWVTPIKTMCRTLTRDLTFYGTDLTAGEKVLLLYEAANFDDGHFEDPETFCVTREPNDHLAFGFGAHFCLGSNLARLELRIMFEQLLSRLPDVARVDDSELPRRQATFITGLETMPVQFTPAPQRSKQRLL